MCLGLLALAGCGEAPSFRVDWRLTQTQDQAAEDAEPLTSVTQCSSVGVASVRVTTLRVPADGEATLCDAPIVDEREFNCFEGPGDGPTLEPGSYKVLVQGLRRTGEPWFCSVDVPQLVPRFDDEGLPVLDPNTGEQVVDFMCLPDDQPCYARAEFELEVVEPPPAEPPLSLVGLLTPPQCDDGVDNDADGMVDRSDLGCVYDELGLESADLGVTLLGASVTFLDDNPLARPVNVGVRYLRLLIDGQPLDDVAASELDESIWPFRLPLQAESIEPGPHTYALVALSAAGEVLASAPEVEFVVPDDRTAFVFEQFDFTSDTFVEPIVAPFELSLARDGGELCKLDGYTSEGRLTIDTIRIRVTDTVANQSLDATTLMLMGSGVMGVDEADGWVSFACPPSNVRSGPLGWGRYAIEVESLAGGDVCFTHPADAELSLLRPAPGGAQLLWLEREPPVGNCIECTGDGTRACESPSRCVDGLCVSD